MTIDIDKDALLAAMRAGDVREVKRLGAEFRAATKHIPLPTGPMAPRFNWGRAAREMLEDEGVLQKKKPVRRRKAVKS